MSREKTQYKRVSQLKEGDYRQIGQYDKMVGQSTLSRLLTKHGERTIYLHGERVNQRFLKAHEAKRRGIMLPEEPQQVRMVVGNIPTSKLEAIKGIVTFEINNREQI
tara:strand:- start:30 stop:350 length:321 start_codon:yes stop_codon:yes gene_type:complete